MKQKRCILSLFVPLSLCLYLFSVTMSLSFLYLSLSLSLPLSLSLSLPLFPSLSLSFSISHYLLPLFLFFYIFQEAERNFGQDPSFWFSIKHKDGGSNAGNQTSRLSNAPYTSETLLLFSHVHCYPLFDYHPSLTLSIALSTPPHTHTKSHPSTSLSLSTQFTFCIFS